MAFGYGNYSGYMQNYPLTYSSAQQPLLPSGASQLQNAAIQPSTTGAGIRLVASKAEVVAAQIPFDGNEYYFKDTSNGKIYVKVFNPMDGTAPIMTYSREQEQAVQYATQEDINILRAEIEALKKPGKAAKKNESDE